LSKVVFYQFDKLYNFFDWLMKNHLAQNLMHWMNQFFYYWGWKH